MNEGECGDETETYVQPRKRILVCAPSNVAVDEIARRLLLEGVHDIARLGIPSSIHSDVTPVSIVNPIFISDKSL